MAASSETRRSRLAAALREGERVTPLELFFDLVFVLAITQCTALMSHHPTWSGLAQGLLVLGMLWWAWVGYAWLTSVIDPEEGAVRLVMFGAMAALLIVSLCVPEAFGSLALAFALVYGVVRTAHIALFMLASPEDDAPAPLGARARRQHRDRRRPAGRRLALRRPRPGRALGARPLPRHGRALLLRLGGLEAGPRPLRRAPRADRDHRPRRVDRRDRRRRRGRADLGIGDRGGAGRRADRGDVVDLLRHRRDGLRPPPGRRRAGPRAQNEMARDSYSYMHLPMVAGIVLVALGLKTTIGHFDDHLHTVPAFALLGGVALYLLGHVAFRYRHVHTINRQRLLLAIVLLILVPVATEMPALVAAGASPTC